MGFPIYDIYDPDARENLYYAQYLTSALIKSEESANSPVLKETFKDLKNDFKGLISMLEIKYKIETFDHDYDFPTSIFDKEIFEAYKDTVEDLENLHETDEALLDPDLTYKIEECIDDIEILLDFFENIKEEQQYMNEEQQYIQKQQRIQKQHRAQEKQQQAYEEQNFPIPTPDDFDEWEDFEELDDEEFAELEAEFGSIVENQEKEIEEEIKREREKEKEKEESWGTFLGLDEEE